MRAPGRLEGISAAQPHDQRTLDLGVNPRLGRASNSQLRDPAIGANCQARTSQVPFGEIRASRIEAQVRTYSRVLEPDRHHGSWPAFRPPPGPGRLILIVVAEEEGRPDTESPRHRLDQALLRVGGLPVAQLPDGGVGDRLPSRVPDQGRDLGAAVGAAAGGMRCRNEPVHPVRQRSQRRCALGAVRNLTRHH